MKLKFVAAIILLACVILAIVDGRLFHLSSGAGNTSRAPESSVGPQPIDPTVVEVPVNVPSAPTPAPAMTRVAPRRTAKRATVASNVLISPLGVPAALVPEPWIPETMAREALNLVGIDAEAEREWVGAINDPALPPAARKNLIEDLNENGFPDHRNITSDDLPLIVSRLELIEQLGPDAVDDVNAEAFAEAYKDLLNMYDKAMR